MAIEIASGDILTSEQLKTHFRVFAGPGAGKTHFLVENVKNIVMTHPFIVESRVRKVLCVTYTNVAVREIQQRLSRFSDSVEVFTIHSFIIEHIIKPFQKDLYDIIQEEFGINVCAKKPITSQIEGLGILHGIDKEEIYNYITKSPSMPIDLGYSKNAMGEIQVDINQYLAHHKEDDFKITLSASDKIQENHILPIKEFMWSIVRKLTHDEILYFGYRILEHNSTALYALRVQFPFILVDEFQDTNPLQTLLIKLVGKKSTIVGVIGDIAQSIYSFQGARPSQFSGLTMDGSTTGLVDYAIAGNRRSTANIVEFCNFLRKSDTSVVQESIRPYDDDEVRAIAEAKPIHFLIGDSDVTKQIIGEVVANGGVVITRAWAKAFAYIREIESAQVKFLSDIYNSYYKSSIDIRAEIAEIGNVTWVRAFKFIFSFHTAFTMGSFADVLNAFKLYVDDDRCGLNLNIKLIQQIKMLADATFSDVTDTSKTYDVIERLNTNIKDDKFNLLRNELLGEEFYVAVFDEYDLTNDSDRTMKFVGALKQLNWGTSYKLFTEVFSKNSRYMTVHQAKGLEWNKVVVSVSPSKFDHIGVNEVYSNPKILQETNAEEFVRMYYVACSRAKEDLYIHLPAGFDTSLISAAFTNQDAYEIVC